jgi:arginine utilization regulatory protein
MNRGLDPFLEQVETALIKEAMLLSNGNITKAAERLKIKRQTLQHKLKKIEINAK